MKTTKNNSILQITSKAKRLILDFLISPYQTEIIEMILTFIDFVNAIISQLG